jgi:membrane-associated protease RseP (regulator of RpoE activity)
MILLCSLIIIIILHELGHFVAAKLCNVKVLQFAVGFGPTIWCKTIGETTYSLNWILLGGFCQLKDELNFTIDNTGLTSKPYLQKAFIVLAGILVNCVTGGLAYFIGWQLYSLPPILFGWYSIAIGLSNLLPIPALDGSYLYIFAFEKLWGKEKALKFWEGVCKKWFKWIMILNLLSLPYLGYLIITRRIL